jgi:hypothetical protein
MKRTLFEQAGAVSGVPPRAAGTDKMEGLQSIVVVMAALATSGLAALACACLWLRGSLERDAEDAEERTSRLEQKLDDATGALAKLTGELHHARADVARLHALVGQLRAEMGDFIHGPPSLRAPVTKLPSRS